MHSHTCHQRHSSVSDTGHFISVLLLKASEFVRNVYNVYCVTVDYSIMKWHM